MSTPINVNITSNNNEIPLSSPNSSNSSVDSGAGSLPGSIGLSSSQSVSIGLSSSQTNLRSKSLANVNNEEGNNFLTFLEENKNLFNEELKIEFNQQEKDLLYSIFMTHCCPQTLVMDRINFTKSLGGILDETGFGNALFRPFIISNNSSINFEEYLYGMNILINGFVLLLSTYYY
jgi:hypothetical protein